MFPTKVVAFVGRRFCLRGGGSFVCEGGTSCRIILASRSTFSTKKLSNAAASSSSMYVYDSLSQSMKDLLATTTFATAVDDNEGEGEEKKKGIAFYTCGPTTYGPAHLGHARTYVCLDVIRRCLERVSSCSHLDTLRSPPPPPPLFVMNITDVDDKILNKASENNESPLELARRYEGEFWRDYDALNCLRPHVVVRVTDHVDTTIVNYIQQICEMNCTYEIDNDGLYFDVRAFDDKMLHMNTKYGKLAPPANSSDFFSTIETSHHASSSPNVNDKKKDPRDFVLWKKRKDGERMYWSSPWGDGRPGWHIECSAMIESIQQMFAETHVFTVHAGGVDLKFPHHTNEIAQAEAYHYNAKNKIANMKKKKEWIEHWIHTGHLHIDGMKMSKSLKNFITVEEVLGNNTTNTGGDHHHHQQHHIADDFRLWCLGLSGHYRSTATYHPDRSLVDARRVRQKIIRFLVDGEEWLSLEAESDDDGDGCTTTTTTTTTTKLWSDDDKDLFDCVNEASTNCMRALLVSDLDGTEFVNEIVRIAATGNAYIRSCISNGNHALSEPVRVAIQTVRDLLSLVGFSDVTCRAGIRQMDGTAEAAAGSSQQVLGGERALLDELVAFRAAVRNVAASGLKRDDKYDDEDEGNNGMMREILRLCDDLRDTIFPSLGVELLDGKVGDEQQKEERISGSTWKYCLPRNVEKEEEESTKVTLSIPSKKFEVPSRDLRSIPLEDFFRFGQYEGQFSEFTDDGMPTKHADDGSNISNRLLKKLRKKRAKHAKRLKEKTTPE